MMSPELRAFLQSWIDWVDSGAVKGEPYYRNKGLCDSLSDEYAWDQPDEDELIQLFAFDGLSVAYPFGEYNFYDRFDNDNQHECPKRLAWVCTKLAEGG